MGETNVAFQDSGVLTRLNLVHCYRSSYIEADDGSDSLYHLKRGEKGLDVALRKREKYGADIVSMIIGSAKWCGWGFLG